MAAAGTQKTKHNYQRTHTCEATQHTPFVISVIYISVALWPRELTQVYHINQPSLLRKGETEIENARQKQQERGMGGQRITVVLPQKRDLAAGIASLPFNKLKKHWNLRAEMPPMYVCVS